MDKETESNQKQKENLVNLRSQFLFKKKKKRITAGGGKLGKRGFF